MHFTRQSGFTLIELLSGFAILAILVAILVPVIGDMMIQSRLVQTTSNMRQIGQAMHLFANEHGGRLSSHNTSNDEDRTGTNVPWIEMVTQYGGGSPIGTGRLEDGVTDLRCPEGSTLENPYHEPAWDKAGQESLRFTYVYNTGWYATGSSWPTAKPPPLSQLDDPSRTILVYSAWVKGFSNHQPLIYPNTYKSGRPVLFADGRVESKAEWVEEIPVSDLRVGIVNSE